MNDMTGALLNVRDVREKYFANVSRGDNAYEHIRSIHGEELAKIYRDWEQTERETP